MYNFFDKISDNPIVASVNQLEQLDSAIDSPCDNIFLLTGNIFNLKEITHRVKSKNKGLYIGIDFIDGFSRDTWGLEYIVKNIYPDGIITTKDNLIKLGKDLGAFTILRLSIFDSTSLQKGIESIKNTRPHVVEILPGIMPRVIKIISKETNAPIVTSGLIMDKEDIFKSLQSGAIAISSTNKKMWYI